MFTSKAPFATVFGDAQSAVLTRILAKSDQADGTPRTGNGQPLEVTDWAYSRGLIPKRLTHSLDPEVRTDHRVKCDDVPSTCDAKTQCHTSFSSHGSLRKRWIVEVIQVDREPMTVRVCWRRFVRCGACSLSGRVIKNNGQRLISTRSL